MEKPPGTSGGFQRFPIEGHICCGACHRGHWLGWRTLRGVTPDAGFILRKKMQECKTEKTAGSPTLRIK